MYFESGAISVPAGFDLSILNGSGSIQWEMINSTYNGGGGQNSAPFRVLLVGNGGQSVQADLAVGAGFFPMSGWQSFSVPLTTAAGGFTAGNVANFDDILANLERIEISVEFGSGRQATAGQTIAQCATYEYFAINGIGLIPPSILAQNNNFGTIDTSGGNVTTASVLGNDTLNAAQATTSNVTLTPGTAPTPGIGSISMNADGTITISDDASPGTYNYSYEICQTGIPNNCSTATATVNVLSNPQLAMTKTADDDELVTVGQVVTYTYRVTNTGNEIVRDVAINDVHNGSGPAPTPADETLFTDAAPTGDSTDGVADNGTWSVLGPGDVVEFTGTYTVTQTDIDNLQ
ncbi:MAG: hypothetical protein AAGK17_10480 [Pseudomonadota bacterium]